VIIGIFYRQARFQASAGRERRTPRPSGMGEARPRPLHPGRGVRGSTGLHEFKGRRVSPW
jgi:hypothetical protein